MSEWISVEDRLPVEYIDIVLVARDKDCVATLPARFIDGKFIVCDGFCTVASRVDFVDPTHWMPLPEPPSAEGGEG